MSSGGVLKSAVVLELLEMIPDAIVVVDPSETIRFTNEAATTLFGYPLGGLAGERLSALMPLEHQGRHDEHVRRFLSAPERRAMSKRVGLEARHASGANFPVEIALSPLTDGGEAFVVAAIRDVSERVRLERLEQEARERLVVAERLATVGLLAASVAHEINNPLTALLTNLELLEAEVQSELVTESREAAAHIRTVVQDLRSISREDQQAPVSLKPLVEAAVRMTRHLVTARAHLQLHLAEVPVILGNPGRLTQVFINLLLNAAQAIPQGAAGQHTVSVATSVVGDEVICEVADTGVGIPPDQLHSLFAAFFTTKEDGVGLGLSIAHKVVTDLGGAISVTSIVGQGTRFTVRFPRAP